MLNTAYEKQDDRLTVKPEGHLDTATSPVLEAELKQHLDGIREVTLDCTDLDYISSAGLRVLLATEQRMEDCGGSLRLIHVNESILEIFELVGFMDIVKVEES